MENNIPVVVGFPPTPAIKMDFGKLMVCKNCGTSLLTHKDGEILCCDNKEPITLKRYVEEVRKEIFNNDEWSFETKDIVAVSGIDLTAELTSSLGFTPKCELTSE